MKLEDLKNLNEEYFELSKEFHKEFGELFDKWFKKAPGAALIHAIHLPLNAVLDLIEKDSCNVLPALLFELPNTFIRFMLPFMFLKSKWGKVSGKEFCKLYRKYYEKHFEEWFPNAQEKENFAKWFEDQFKNLSKKEGS